MELVPSDGVIGDAPWKRYVVHLCRNAWELDEGSVELVLQRLDTLVGTDWLTDDAIAGILRDAGVTLSASGMIAQSIRVALRATTRPDARFLADLARRVAALETAGTDTAGEGFDQLCSALD